MQAVLVAGVGLVGILVQQNRKVLKRSHDELGDQLAAVLEQLELAVGDLRRETKSR